LNARRQQVLNLYSTDYAMLALASLDPFQVSLVPQEEKVSLASSDKSSCEELTHDRGVHPVELLRWGSAIAGSPSILATVVAGNGLGNWVVYGAA